ncbi:hypothetical protein [Thiolapillus sp.]
MAMATPTILNMAGDPVPPPTASKSEGWVDTLNAFSQSDKGKGMAFIGDVSNLLENIGEALGGDLYSAAQAVTDAVDVSGSFPEMAQLVQDMRNSTGMPRPGEIAAVGPSDGLAESLQQVVSQRQNGGAAQKQAPSPPSH